METLEKKAAALLERAETVILASIGPDGYPRPVPLSKIKSEGCSTVWMATGKSSLKTKDFSLNPKGGLCFYENGNSVALTGEVEVVTDEAVKKELWQDWFIAHFPGGPADPEYILLKFTGDRATFWIDGAFVHRTLKQRAGK